MKINWWMAKTNNRKTKEPWPKSLEWCDQNSCDQTLKILANDPKSMYANLHFFLGKPMVFNHLHVVLGHIIIIFGYDSMAFSFCSLAFQNHESYLVINVRI